MTRIFFIITIIITTLLTTTHLPAADFTVAFWNVENLFDEYDDPRLPAEDLLTSVQVRNKLENDARVIKHLDADVIGLMEVENHQVLRELVAKHLFSEGYYYFLLLEGADTRGIDTAIISKHPFLARSFAIPNFPRGILAARFTVGGDPLYVLVNHWKSRRGGGEDKRIDAAKTVVQIVNTEIKRYEGKQVSVIVGGDFNDDHDDRSIQILTSGGLVDTQANQTVRQRWTHGYFNNDTNSMDLLGFDQIHINATLANSPTIRWRKTEVIRPNFMINNRVIRGEAYDMPLDDYRDRIGYSDHFPVMATFQIP